MHFLLTNDDGIDAPGIAALEAAVRLLPGSQVTVVAPDGERSLCGHRVTTHVPLIVQPRGEGRFAISGTPADAVRVALYGLGLKPDYVLSGVNAGGNMGQDMVISGTMAAAREAAYHRVPAAAFSHYLIRHIPVDWERTARWTAEVLAELLQERLGDGEFWCVNFPHLPTGPIPLPARKRTHSCREPLNVHYAHTVDAAGNLVFQYDAAYSERPQTLHSDVEACFGGAVAVIKALIC